MLLNKIALFCVTSIFLAQASYAFKLSPMSVELMDKGKKATKSFRVINTGKEKVKVEAELYSRKIDINNNEKREETSDFTLFPPQLEVEPGKSRVIRVSYVGKKVETEKAYRLVVRQIPDINKKKKEGAQIDFLFEYVASVYVTPPSAKADIVVEKSLKISDQLEITFKNRGNKHVLLRRYNLRVTQGKKKEVISFNSKRHEKFGSENILAGLTRKLVLKDQKFDPGKVEIEFIPVK